MRRSRDTGRKAAVAAIVLGAALLLAAGYLALPHDTSDSSSVPTPSATPSLQSTQAERIDPSKNPFDPGDGDQRGFGTNGLDPLANAQGDTRIHDVTVTLRSDGPIKWMFRTRAGDGPVQNASGPVSFTKRVRGPLPAAQVLVQVLPRSTYATCSISIDGRRVDSSTSRTAYQVIACTG